MISILAIAHIVLSIFLVVLVLIQDPKGGAGAMFGGGGGSNSLFGATGAPTFLARLTRWVAVVFAASCIAMTIFIKPASRSVLDGMAMPQTEKSDSVDPIPAEESSSKAPESSETTDSQQPKK